MKTIKIEQLTPGQWIECVKDFIMSDGKFAYKKGNLYQVRKVDEDYIQLPDELGSKYHSMAEGYLNEHFRHPVLTEGKEYECVLRCNFRPFHKGEKYIYSDYTAQCYWFKNKSGGKHAFAASEVLTHFGIDVREGEVEINDLQQRINDNIGFILPTPPLPDEDIRDMVYAMETDTPKPEGKDLTYWKANAEEDYLNVPISVLRYITEMESRIKELEGEIAMKTEYYENKFENLHKSCSEQYKQLQALKTENDTLRRK